MRMHLRIFISSPDDVAEERAFARQVIEQELPKDPFLRGEITCEAMCWDDPNARVAMPALLAPQEAVNLGLAKPSECDVVVVILWSKMGTPLPETYRKPDGTRYMSGTEWEFLDALLAPRPPHILVYQRTTKITIDPDDPGAVGRCEQRQRVKDFFAKTFRNEDGSLKAGYAGYDTPQEFGERLRRDLRTFINQRIKKSAPPRSPKPSHPPYTSIAKALGQGRVVPIIGGGESACGRPPDAVWNPSAPRFLPSGIELSRWLADEAGFPNPDDRDDLAEVSSYYEVFQTRPALRERLRQCLDIEALVDLPIPVFCRFFADIAVPLLIITTRYDMQIEQAFHAANKDYDLVVYPADRKDLANAVLWWPHGATEPLTPVPNELDIDLATTSVIYKMHGSIVSDTDEWDGFVITEEDYVEFLSRLSSRSAIPSLFSHYCRGRSLLFIGYNLRDWKQRVIFKGMSRLFLRRATESEDEIPSWAIEESLSELEARLWQKRGVVPYEVALNQFIENLSRRMVH